MEPPKVKIVVLGGGFAGAYCVRDLQRRLKSDDVRVTLINSQNNFVFTPMLVEAATSALEPRHVVIPLRCFCRGAEFLMADVQTVDFESRIVTAQVKFGNAIQVEYDHLVLALGAVASVAKIDGVREYAFQLKTLSDAMARLR